MKNPFSLSFGIKPEQFISRPVQAEEIQQMFNDELPSSHAYLLVGVRGCGKTVLLSDISNNIVKDDRWIVVALNPERDMLNALAAKLHSNASLKPIFVKAKLDLSILGIGLSIEDGFVISDVESAIEKMLELITNSGKRVLVTVDEVANTRYMREFSAAFQIFIRQNYNVFLLMTGLYGNINSLQNEKTLTFLYRTPRILLEPLNITIITTIYEKMFGISRDFAQQMSFMTKGYAFAFQVLGYLTWSLYEGNITDPYEDYNSRIIPGYDQYLQEYVYIKLWSELSSKEQDILKLLTHDENKKISEIRSKIGMESNEFGVYRDRLIKKGVITSQQRGSLDFALPRFEEYIMRE